MLQGWQSIDSISGDSNTSLNPGAQTPSSFLPYTALILQHPRNAPPPRPLPDLQSKRQKSKQLRRHNQQNCRKNGSNDTHAVLRDPAEQVEPQPEADCLLARADDHQHLGDVGVVAVGRVGECDDVAHIRGALVDAVADEHCLRKVSAGGVGRGGRGDLRSNGLCSTQTSRT